MKALLLVAHGSRRQASNQEVTELTGVITEEMQGEYPIIETGFLELATPLIPEAIQSCVDQNATEIHIVPYFLAAGRHVQEDIPEEVEKARLAHPDVTMIVHPHVGGSPLMTSLIKGTLSDHKAHGMHEHLV